MEKHPPQTSLYMKVNVVRGWCATCNRKSQNEFSMLRWQDSHSSRQKSGAWSEDMVNFKNISSCDVWGSHKCSEHSCGKWESNWKPFIVCKQASFVPVARSILFNDRLAPLPDHCQNCSGWSQIATQSLLLTDTSESHWPFWASTKAPLWNACNVFGMLGEGQSQLPRRAMGRIPRAWSCSPQMLGFAWNVPGRFVWIYLNRSQWVYVFGATPRVIWGTSALVK